MAVICPSCDQALPDDAGVCSNCGQPIPAPKNKGTLPLNVIIPAALALALIVGGIWWYLNQNPVTPDLQAMTTDEASATLSQAGFTLGDIAYDASSSEVTWTVIAQTADAGERLRRGTLVGVTLAGAPPASVPDVTGLPRAQAESTIASATLTTGATTEQYHSTIPAGAVISQEPTAGVEVPERTTVALVLSKGPQPVPVPKVTGGTEADAVAALKAAGFTVTTSPKDDAAAKGTVLSQTPAADTAVLPGTAVTIEVSTGVELVKVPSYEVFQTDYPEDDWASYLEHYIEAVEAGFRRAGLIPDVQITSAYDSEDDYQSPKAGSMVPRGTTVHVRIPVYD